MIAFLCLFALAQATTAEDATNNRPVSKVINLLKDMQTQLSKEQKADEEVYEKVTCWCTTNDADKTTAISDAESRITDLTATIEEDTASSSRLNAEIANLKREIAKNTAALEKATALRKKEVSEFTGEEKDLMTSIGAMGDAVKVLGKHNSFMQVDSESASMAASMVSTLKQQFKKHDDLLSEIASPEQRKAVAAFMQSASPTSGAGSYAPQSGAIFGILEQMKESFETNLANSQKEETSSQAAYKQLKSAKNAEIKAGQDQRDAKTQELADTNAHNAQAKQDLEDTSNSLSADQEFLMNLKETCKHTDAEWEERSKTRQEEIQACGEALAVLDSDEAHDTFARTLGFVQVKSTDRRIEAANVISQAAKKFDNPRMSALATRARLDAFVEVVKEIDTMVSALKTEQADDVTKKDFCVKEIKENERNAELKARDLAETGASIDEMTSYINNFAANIKDLHAEVAEARVQLKRAGENREAENTDFQTTVADQRATQELLTAALTTLKGFYEKKEALVQEPAGPPPPTGFKKYENAGASGGVMGMLEQIIAEAKQLEQDAITAESDAIKAYETFVKDTNNLFEDDFRDLANKNALKAQYEEDLVAAQATKDTQTTEQEELTNENTDLHKQCDFLLANFDIRAAALEQEQESLGQAKSILSGSSMKAFLQIN